MRDEDQDKSNCDLAYMTSSWMENQVVQTRKKSFKESSCFEKSRCKLGSKVAHFFVIFALFYFLTFSLVAKIL
jgi:hypothetical protein